MAKKSLTVNANSAKLDALASSAVVKDKGAASFRTGALIANPVANPVSNIPPSCCDHA